jgi:hypothetical protein
MDVEWVTVGFITLLSLAVRLSVVAGAPFPINDGGLFYGFTSDLLANGLRLPDFASYNAASIPLVYPPLAFYLTAILHLASRLPVLQLIQFVPAVVSAASIPAFFDLAARMLRSPRAALLATFAFAMIPRTFDWLIMGGGITRSFGLLFSLLFLGQAHRLFVQENQRALVPAILSGGLLILSHPEAAVHTVITTGLLIAWYGRTRANLRRCLLVVSGIALITAPWWGLVLARHGFDPWIAAIRATHQDSYDPLLGLVALLRFDFTDEPFLRIFGVMGLLGLVVQLARREYFLTAWLTLLHLVEPRGGTLFMMLPLAMSVGILLDGTLIPALESPTRLAESTRSTAAPKQSRTLLRIFGGGVPAMLLGYLLLYGMVASYFMELQLRQSASLTSRDTSAFEWIAENTPTDSGFALVTGGKPLLDPTSDWFPAITGRRSVASYFGAEWIHDLEFSEGLARYSELQLCANQETSCLKDWARGATEPVEYVYVRSNAADQRTALQESLAIDADFRLVYSENGVDLYHWVGQHAW